MRYAHPLPVLVFFFFLFFPQSRVLPPPSLSQSSGLTLPLEEAEDVSLPHGPLDIAHNGARRIIDELGADLGHVTGVAGAAQDAVHLGELYGIVLGLEGVAIGRV